jgi:hypothetical protein
VVIYQKSAYCLLKGLLRAAMAGQSTEVCGEVDIEVVEYRGCLVVRRS